jgi:acyl-coenzyme A thioesterase PaaI-like protein
MPTKSEIIEFLRQEFPETPCSVLEVGNAAATIRYPVRANDLRPGGTVAGYVLMTVADVALYVAILGVIGIVPLTVTTSLNINFLRKPTPARDILGACKLIKVGRSLAVGEVELYSDGVEGMVAHAVGTYSIPPDHGLRSAVKKT